MDRSLADRHKELRELRWWQVAAVVTGMVGAAASVWLSAEYGPWSWLDPVRRFQRHAAMALLGLATVAALYGVSLAFR